MGLLAWMLDRFGAQGRHKRTRDQPRPRRVIDPEYSAAFAPEPGSRRSPESRPPEPRPVEHPPPRPAPRSPSFAPTPPQGIRAPLRPARPRTGPLRAHTQVAGIPDPEPGRHAMRDEPPADRSPILPHRGGRFADPELQAAYDQAFGGEGYGGMPSSFPAPGEDPPAT